ncbi:MAG TPA: hypothetical protein ENJ01_05280 [Gammaproteobacteria bacterium]|nr:hypothetical protein [Gammaproteobacteria bacterium]
MKTRLLLFIALLLTAFTLQAREVSITVFKLKPDGLDNTIGVIVARDTPRGIEFTPHLRGLPPGNYELNVHTGFACGSQYNPDGSTVMGMAAGGIYVPVSIVRADRFGEMLEPVFLPKMKVADLSRRTLVLQRTDGGGFDEGLRVACGSLELY